MADEPSMDEILASLDQLLKESESRRGEVKAFLRSSSTEAEPKHSTEKVTKQQEHSNTRKAEAPIPRFFMALDHAVSAPSNDAGESEPGDTVKDVAKDDIGNSGSKQHGHASLLQSNDAGDPELAEKDEGDAKVEVVNSESEQHKIVSVSPLSAQGTDTRSTDKRIVLTDAMMVKDVQQSLPLAMGRASSETDVQEKTPEEYRESPVEKVENFAPDPVTIPAAPVHSIPWSEENIVGLIDQVTDDVCSAMAAQLPGLIRRALEDRLFGFKDDWKQNKDSDSGIKE